MARFITPIAVFCAILYLVSLMVIVTQSTSSVAITSWKPLGLDKFANYVAHMKQFLSRAGVLLKASPQKPPMSPGTVRQPPEVQFSPPLVSLPASHWRAVRGGQTAWRPTYKLLQEFDLAGCHSGCFSDLLPVFSPGSECAAAHSSFSLTWAWPPLVLWLGPQRASPGLGFHLSPAVGPWTSYLTSLVLSLLPQNKKAGWDALRIPAPSFHPLLSMGKEAWPRSYTGNPGWRAGWWRSWCTSVATVGTLNPDLEAASPGPWEAAGVQGTQAPMGSRWYDSGLRNAEAGGAWAGLWRGLRL